PLHDLKAGTFTTLFGLPLSDLYRHHRSAAPGLLDLCLPNGVRVRARAVLQLNSASCAPTLQAEPAAPRRAPARLSGLRYLNTGDPKLAQVIEKVNKVLGRDVPIMIMGETGTGKELLAQAIHQDSPRAHAPFVAVNCASIPEALIESELFGYEEGAFTGARRKGAPGKIVQANGGTLFLDEIGDMPMPLQARLLRVLQERVVTPLGSSKAIPVDVELICATNQNLRERIAQGLFREDLYYRLNGLVVKLPALRERTDLDTVVRRILAAEGEPGKYILSDEALSHFKRHPWPGNLRQLTSLLRTAVIMAGEEGEIGMQHLPDDFLDDLGGTASAPARTAPAATATRLGDLELDAIRNAVAAHGGNVAAAARALGISRNTVYRKLSRPG
ncbi:MAG TPA: sigma 54-interacting transcriptional regulator, partial [Telluria sp.]|nr:sigma 54-interacting transcriptional regulator [Telluria sp.]